MAGFTDAGANRCTRRFARLAAAQAAALAAALAAASSTASLRSGVIRANAVARFLFLVGFRRLADNLGIDEYLDRQKCFECFRAILFRRFNRFNIKASKILAHDALGVEVNTPEAAAGKDWLADDYLTQALAGKVPDIPVERRCVGTASLNRIYNVHLTAARHAQKKTRGAHAVRGAVTSPEIMPKRSESPATSLDSGIFAAAESFGRGSPGMSGPSIYAPDSSALPALSSAAAAATAGNGDRMHRFAAQADTRARATPSKPPSPSLITEAAAAPRRRRCGKQWNFSRASFRATLSRNIY